MLRVEFDVSDGFLMKIYKPVPLEAFAAGPGSGSGSSPAPESASSLAPGSTTAADGSEPASEQPNHESPSKVPEEVAEIYLVEPWRLTSTVVKYSGTLGSTTRTDLRSVTMAAFAHYVARETACQYVFADIQGPFPCFHAHQCGVKFIEIGRAHV